MKIFRFLLYFLLFFQMQAQIEGQFQYPKLIEIVTDNARLFSETEVLQLRQKLTTYEKETTHQIAVVTVNSLQGNTVENYALRVFNDNGLGQKGVDNGILILISKNDRKFRIEVGYGLEPIITDAFASRINRSIITPQFKKDQFYKGIDDATTEIINLIEDPKYRDEFAEAIEKESKLPIWLLGIFLVVFAGFGGFIFFNAYKRYIYLYRGVLTGKVSLLSFPLYWIGGLMPFFFGLIFVVAGIFAVYMTSINVTSIELSKITKSPYFSFTNFIIILILLLFIIPLTIAYFTRSKTYKPIKFSYTKNNKPYMSKHFSSSGSSSGGGFSGGGGSSGGGGASGSW